MGSELRRLHQFRYGPRLAFAGLRLPIGDLGLRPLQFELRRLLLHWIGRLLDQLHDLLLHAVGDRREEDFHLPRNGRILFEDFVGVLHHVHDVGSVIEPDFDVERPDSVDDHLAALIVGFLAVQLNERCLSGCYPHPRHVVCCQAPE